MLRVLIADDDVDALYRTQRMLRGFQAAWQLKFCHGPRLALDALALDAYSVVVSNTMAGGDGAALLECARDLYPEIVRILICTPAEHTEMIQGHGPAHHYLTRPVDPVAFREAVARAAALEQRLTKPGLRALISKITTLPSLPAIYTELLQELRRNDASVARVAELIGQDVGMTAKLLQLVNNSFYGLPVHVQDVKHAASLLGLNALKPLVLSAGVFRQLESGRVPPLLAEQVLEHSLAVGRLARRIAEAEGLSRYETDNAMLGGILHDIGKLVLADHFGPHYSLVCLAAERAELSLLTAELDQFHASHADVGGYLLGLWGLPQDLVEAVALHHEPCAHGVDRMTPLAAVHAANALVHAAEADDGQEPPIDGRYLKKIHCERRLAAWQELAGTSVVQPIR